MNFVTLEFATFFLFVLVAGWLLRERDGEYRAFLLVCNLFFYALAGMAFVPLLLAVAVLKNYGNFARALYSSSRIQLAFAASSCVPRRFSFPPGLNRLYH